MVLQQQSELMSLKKKAGYCVDIYEDLTQIKAWGKLHNGYLLVTQSQTPGVNISNVLLIILFPLLHATPSEMKWFVFENDKSMNLNFTVFYSVHVWA